MMITNINKELREDKILDGVLDASIDAILVVDLTGNIMQYNSKFIKMWSIPDHLIRKDVDRENLRYLFNQLIEPKVFFGLVRRGLKNKTITLSDNLSLKDGRIIEIIANPFNLNGETVGRLWSFRDITTSKLAQRRNIETANRFRALIDSSDVGIFSMVEYFEDCNQKVCEIFECEKEDIIGYEPSEFSPDFQPDGRDSIEASKKYIELALNDVPQSFYWQHKTKTGKLIDTEVSLKKVEINNRSYIQALVRDITAQMHGEKIRNAIFKISESVNSTENMDTLYQKLHDIISELMPANNFYLALYDEESELLSFPYFVDEYDPPQPPKKLGKGLTEYVLRSGQDILVDAKKDEELRASGEVELIGEPQAIWLGIALKLEGKTMGVMVLQDYENPKAYGEEEKQILIFVSEQIAIAIDRKRKIENLKKLTEEYRQLNATKDKFFSIIAHDLKNPFNTLLGFSDMLSEDYYEMSDEERLEYVSFIKRTSEGTLSLLQNLLQWSRSQTGRISYNPENINIPTLIQNVIDLIGQNAELKNITVKNGLTQPMLAFTDKDMINTVVRNLFTNAIKFTPKGGEISITAYQSNSHMEVRIKDTGVGMDERTMDSLFQIDKSCSSPGTEGEKGTGLGLILCKEFIERNGGKIWVESEIGKGSTFIFTLPRPSHK